jgi:biotin-dependent carboxylase-like uncharacterized protein
VIEILDPGPLASVQDRGRPGYASVGVPRSGAFDRAALDLANRLVGNHAGAAALEITFGGLTMRVGTAATIAVAGAEVPGLDWGIATTLRAGSVVTLGVPRRGVRTYLAVRGGFAVHTELGSRSTDTLSGLGPPPLRAGDRLSIGTDIAAVVAGVPAAPTSERRHLRIIIGPRADWFVQGAIEVLTATHWLIGPESDRVGLRLRGPAIQRVRDAELVSEPTLPGAIQIPPDGQPIVFGPDSPVTGGYPVLAVVRRADLDVAAQLRPGDVVRFTG